MDSSKDYDFMLRGGRGGLDFSLNTYVKVTNIHEDGTVSGYYFNNKHIHKATPTIFSYTKDEKFYFTHFKGDKWCTEISDNFKEAVKHFIDDQIDKILLDEVY